MKLLKRISSVAPVTRMRADLSRESQAFFSGEDVPGWGLASLSAAGVTVTPELARTLSAIDCGVRTMSYDLATLPLQTFKYRDDGGKDRIRGHAADYLRGGIGDLAYMLQWAPNNVQTATEYFTGQVTQFLLRGKAYAEIISGPSGFLEQLLPRHPDRVFPERLPSGRLRYKLMEANGQFRYVTQDEMHVVRDGGSDPLSTTPMMAYASGSIGTALAAERAAGKFFKSGMTSALAATYKGDMEDEDERALHSSITRYGAGVENNFGLLLIPDDVTITNLGIDPERAQMMAAREWTVFEVARWLRISPRKLMIRTAGAGGYNSGVDDQVDHAVNCIRPLAHTFEQAIQRDLILARDTYFTKFDLRELMRGNPTQVGEFIEKAVKNRAMTPSEIRTLLLDLNPDPHLDKLSESDNQPGKSTTAPADGSAAPQQARSALKGMLAVHDNAVRCLRRERAAIEKLAKRYAADVDGWKTGLRDFYDEHSGFVAQTMRISLPIARGYAAQHGSEFEAQGTVLIDGAAGEAWERFEAAELAELAVSEGHTVDDWFSRRLVDARLSAQTTIHVPVQVDSPVTIAKDAIQVDARTTVEGARVEVQTPDVTVAKGAVQVNVQTPKAPNVTVEPAVLTIQKGAVQVDARTTIQQPRLVKKTIERDKDKQVSVVREEYK
jgi:HK97 family phage portal protein